MKDAVSDSNMTVIALVLIGILAGVITPIIRGIMTNSRDRANCLSTGGAWQGGQCQDGAGNPIIDVDPNAFH